MLRLTSLIVPDMSTFRLVHRWLDVQADTILDVLCASRGILPNYPHHLHGFCKTGATV